MVSVIINNWKFKNRKRTTLKANSERYSRLKYLISISTIPQLFYPKSVTQTNRYYYYISNICVCTHFDVRAIARTIIANLVTPHLPKSVEAISRRWYFYYIINNQTTNEMTLFWFLKVVTIDPTQKSNVPKCSTSDWKEKKQPFDLIMYYFYNFFFTFTK